eukprot:m.202152 g.202152  ORF g.202152 m.202152 type:complete len:1333 (-) comp13719_c1_seq6:1622-5620(-)
MSKRLHVLREIFATEKEYVKGLRMIKSAYLNVLREQPDIFSAEDIQQIFINIEDILLFQEDFLAEMTAVDIENNIGACEDLFIKHKEEFLVYTTFCNGHVNSVELLCELASSPNASNALKQCHLKSGSVLNLEAFLLSVIQRICKYPLLMKELKKSTTDEKQLERAQQALDAMLYVADCVNEDKRRMENLQLIDNWQAMVSNWSGPSLRDTSRHLLCQGPLTKWTKRGGKKFVSNNRWFFLFDNVLIYCKGSPQCAKKGKTDNESVLKDGEDLIFKGRIDTRNITVFDIEDGKGLMQTGGQVVTNAFKISNQAKGKWYVLACSDEENKQMWMDSLLEEQGRYFASLAGRMARVATYDTKGSELKNRIMRHSTKSGKKFIRSVKKGVRTYHSCFSVDGGIIHHVNDKAGFENSSKLYRFRIDDGTYEDKELTRNAIATGLTIYTRLLSSESFDIVGTKTYHMKTYECCFEGCDLVDWLIENKFTTCRQTSVVLGQALLEAGVIRHVSDEHKFEDKSFFYVFTADTEFSKKGRAKNQRSIRRKSTLSSPPKKRALGSVSTSSFTFKKKDNSFGFTLTSERPCWIRCVDANSSAEAAGVVPGDYVLKVNDTDVTELSHKDVVKTIIACGETVTLEMRSRAIMKRMLREARKSDAARKATNDINSFTQRVFAYISSRGQKMQAIESLDESFVTVTATAAFVLMLLQHDKKMLEELEGATFSSDANEYATEEGVYSQLRAEVTNSAATEENTVIGDDYDDEVTDETASCFKHVVENRVKELEKTYHQMQTLEKEFVTFKSSTKKEDELFTFLPTNLHHQKMEVLGDNEVPTTYDYTTVGAFSAMPLRLSNTHLGWEALGQFNKDAFDVLKRCCSQWSSLKNMIGGFTGLLKNAADKKQSMSFIGAHARYLMQEIRNSSSSLLLTSTLLLANTTKAKKLSHAVLRLQNCVFTLQEQHADTVLDELDAVSECATKCYYDVCVKARAVMFMQLSQVNPLPPHPPRLGVTFRQDILFVQAATTVVSAMSSKIIDVTAELLQSKATSHEWVDTLCTTGALISFQSLLSTGDAEFDILADHAEAVNALRSLTFSFKCKDIDKSENCFHVYGTRLSPHVEFYVSKPFFSTLSSSAQKGQTLCLCPVLFNQGVNDIQSASNAFDASEMQDIINQNNFYHLEKYCNRVREELLTKISVLSANTHEESESKLEIAELERREQEILSLLGAVGGDVLSFGSKTLNLLLSMQTITKAVNGLTVISCKSGKDRTAMLVTLHQVCELVREHNLPFNKLRDILDNMRTAGVRMENLLKNTGKAKFAFSQEQVDEHLPVLLRPPPGSFGKNTS